jgi:hypothetical protein
MPFVEPAVERLYLAAVDLRERVEHAMRKRVIALLECRDRHEGPRLPNPVVRA